MAMLFSLFLLAAPARAAAPADPGAMTVVSVAGGRLSVGGRELAAGDALKPGKTIALSAGEAVLDAPGAGRLMLKGPASFTPSRSGGRLASGGLLSALPFLKGRFEVHAGPITAAVRGTTFFVDARGEEAYLCLCEGALELGGRGKAKAFHKRLSTKAHAASLYRADGAKLLEKPGKLERHGDSDIERLLAR